MFAKDFSESVISLPFYPTMTEEEQQYVLNSLKTICEELRP
jgi:dTDP-4-amino-4,6-dideoxygalactose transaminase